MHFPDFALERFFARWEFAVRHVLCASDVEGWRMRDLLALADDETRALWDTLALGYTESTGHPLLRAEIARLYTGIGPDDVLVFAGAEEGIFAAMHVLLGPGAHAVVVWPAYQSLHEVARATGADVTLVPLDHAEGWTLDVDRVRRALRPSTRVIVVNFPHSPTGALPDRATWDALVTLARDAGVHLFSDEVYRLLELDPSECLPAAVDVLERGVSLGVMSKAFGLAGLRIGWIATRDAALRARLAAFKDYTTICSSAPSEVLSIIALRARERVVARSMEIIARNVPLLDAFFASQAGTLEWVRPRAGTVAFPRLTAPVPIDTFCAELVETEGVLLLPGTLFGHEGNHFRIGFGRADLADALPRLERFVARRLRG